MPSVKLVQRRVEQVYDSLGVERRDVAIEAVDVAGKKVIHHGVEDVVKVVVVLSRRLKLHGHENPS